MIFGCIIYLFGLCNNIFKKFECKSCTHHQIILISRSNLQFLAKHLLVLVDIIGKLFLTGLILKIVFLTRRSIKASFDSNL